MRTSLISRYKAAALTRQLLHLMTQLRLGKEKSNQIANYIKVWNSPTDFRFLVNLFRARLNLSNITWLVESQDQEPFMLYIVSADQLSFLLYKLALLQGGAPFINSWRCVQLNGHITTAGRGFWSPGSFLPSSRVTSLTTDTDNPELAVSLCW